MKSFMPLAVLISIPALASTSMDLQKGACRRGVMDMAETAPKTILSPIQYNDRAEDLVDEPQRMIRNVRDMEQKGLLSGQSKDVPWSDSYWPLAQGALGQRYMDLLFPGWEWKKAFDYIQANPASKLVEEGKLDQLSPSEKYDYLMGLESYPLTQINWQDGGGYFSTYGRVESWMGLCHGWAAVSMMMPEPKKTVSINTSKGAMNLFVSDIKGLATLLWSKGGFRTKFIGGRCNDKDPRRDSSGRPVEPDCLDNNPGTWHLAVVNQLGVSKRPFIMDATADYEVWNHPVYSYEYVYVNMKTKKPFRELDKAVVDVSDYQDPKSKFRARDTKFLVGVRMVVSYAVENSPTPLEEQEIEYREAEYQYDLELDSKLNIIGGEWNSRNHPDFLWVPVRNVFPQSYADRGQAVNLERLSPEEKKLAQINAERGLPWGPVVRFLVNKSANP